MMEKRSNLEVTDTDASVKRFGILTQQGVPSVKTITRPWQTGDPLQPWRQKFDFSDGLGTSRYRGENTYERGNFNWNKNGTITPPPYFGQIHASKVKYIGGKVNSTTANTSHTISVSALDEGTIAENDLILVFIWQSVDQAFNISGYTLLWQESGTSADRIAIYYKVAGGSEGNGTATVSASANLASKIMVFEGCDTTTPIDDNDHTVFNHTNGSGETSFTPPPVTPTQVDGKMLWGMFYADDSSIGSLNNTFYNVLNKPEIGWWSSALIGIVATQPAYPLHDYNHEQTTEYQPDDMTFDDPSTGRYVSWSLSLKAASTIANSTLTGTPIQFGDKLFVHNDTAIYYLDHKGSLTYDVDILTDYSSRPLSLAVFNGELIVTIANNTMKILKRSDSDRRGTWSQASDNTYGFVLGVVGDKLWRVYNQQALSNAITAPLTLASWVPSSGNEYNVGTSDYYPRAILSYDGSPWVVKVDGVYAPDNVYEFVNQAPQLESNKSYENGWGSFTAAGYIWVPFNGGLLRITIGESIQVGPELNYSRPLITNGGFEFGGKLWIYANERVFGFKNQEEDLWPAMILAGIEGEDGYIWECIGEPQSWDNASYVGGWHTQFGIVSPNSGASVYTNRAFGITNNVVHSGNQFNAEDYYMPTMFISGGANSTFAEQFLSRIISGATSAKQHPTYLYNTYMNFQTGYFNPTGDLNTEFLLTGFEWVSNVQTDDAMTVNYHINGQYPVDTSLMYEDGETASDSTFNNSAYSQQRHVAYTALDTDGVLCRSANMMFTMSGVTPATGVSPPEFSDFSAFGYMQPQSTDVKRIQLYLDDNDVIDGTRNGMSLSAVSDFWRTCKNDGKVRLMKLPDYEEGNNTYFKVGGVEEDIIDVGEDRQIAVVNIDLVRINYKGDYAA